MKYKGTLISDMSGRLGGLVASHNTYGTYLRRHVKPVNPRTPFQQAQRAAVASTSGTWRSLDPTVQAAWGAAAVVKTSRKGDRVTLSGAAAFNFVNILRVRAGASLITDPPSGSDTMSMSAPTIAFTAANIADVTFLADAWNLADGVVNISAALITSLGVAFKRANRGVVQLIDPGTGAVSVALPFSVPIGARARLEFHASGPDGRQTTYVTVDALNTSFPPPVPVLASVVSVTAAAPDTAIWEFDRDITPGVGADLLIATRVYVAQYVVDPTHLLLQYTDSPTTGDAWSIASGTATVPASVVPQAGLVL
jgi:hypothetical protein